MKRPVTRSISRVLGRAGVRYLSRISVVIRRNPRIDAAALQNRNVIIQRRASVSPMQQANTAQPTRRMSMISLSSTSNSNNGAFVVPVNVVQSDNTQMAGTSSSLDSSPMIDDHHTDNSLNVVPVNVAQADDTQMAATSSTLDSIHNHQIEQGGDGGNVGCKTNFPGHTKKRGRISFFNQSDMDKYVFKFQPQLTDNRPPISRMNRFSLDSIPE